MFRLAKYMLPICVTKLLHQTTEDLCFKTVINLQSLWKLNAIDPCDDKLSHAEIIYSF